ncbi:integumentary mucin C.1-like [Neocloeon triangulifer]|uniref:integumentary mucin C.1-like n=1 Tax=Neocloeon triangulifer TaxID=2078957 RepID=UPI00286F6653|nr:integumentary mucin C.1-like [Neocloeon triangulifer]
MKAILLVSSYLIVLVSAKYNHYGIARDYTFTPVTCPPCDCTTTTTPCPTVTSTTTTPCPTTTTTTPCPTTTTPCPTTTTTTPCPTTTTPCVTTTPCPHPPNSPGFCPPCVMNRCTPDACSLGANVPYPGDCTKFCKCDFDGATPFDCPAGLHFNDILQLCDWPSAAKCTLSSTYEGGCEMLTP